MWQPARRLETGAPNGYLTKRQAYGHRVRDAHHRHVVVHRVRRTSTVIHLVTSADHEDLRRCMACPANGVLPLEAAVTSSLMTVAYVGLLYLPFNHGPRDSRRTIVRRLLTLTLFTLLFELYIQQRVPLLKMSPRRVLSFSVSVCLTLLLYAGHLLATARMTLLASLPSFTGLLNATPSSSSSSTAYAVEPAVALRNYIVAPMLEELVFRRQTLMLWQCATPSTRLLVPALLFALAHVHHVYRLGVVGLLFQLAYTFLFGIYAAALYLNTQTVWAPYAAHMVCNMLEIPNFAAIGAHRHWRAISVVYALSLALFAVSFGPVTTRFGPHDVASV